MEERVLAGARVHVVVSTKIIKTQGNGLRRCRTYTTSNSTVHTPHTLLPHPHHCAVTPRTQHAAHTPSTHTPSTHTHPGAPLTPTPTPTPTPPPPPPTQRQPQRLNGLAAGPRLRQPCLLRGKPRALLRLPHLWVNECCWGV